MRMQKSEIEIKSKKVSGDLSERLLTFSVNIIKTIKKLENSFECYHIGNQIIRSSTSAGANYEEAKGAESKADFIHKLQIVLKELKETKYWLKLIFQLELIIKHEIDILIQENEELIKIFSKSVVTAKSNH